MKTVFIKLCLYLRQSTSDKNIDIIRVGLQNTDEISDPSCEKSEVVAGPYHPAFRQLVEAGLWMMLLLKKLKS